MKKFFFSLLSLAVVFTASAQTLVRVNTYDNLVSIVPHGTDPKMIAFVGGDSDRNDGFGGVFYYNGDSVEATNNFGIFRPATVASDEPGRWYRLAGQFWNQDSAVGAADENSYVYRLYRDSATNVFGLGADNSNVYLQSWNGYSLRLNDQGNNTIINRGGGNVGIGTASPQATLSVSDRSLSAITGEPSAVGTLRILSNGGAATSGIGGLEFKSATSGNGYGWRLHSYNDGGGTIPLLLQKRSNSATWTTAFSADDSTGSITYYGPQAFRPSSLQTLAAGNAITAISSTAQVAGSGGSVTLTSAPTIANGVDGQLLYIIGTSANAVTVQDQDTLPSSNLQLGASTRAIGLGDVLVLIYSSTVGDWLEVSFANN